MIDFMMVIPAGFEPTACRLGGDRSILLSYGTRSQLLFQLLSYGSKTLNSKWFRAVFVNWKRREREAGLIQSRCILP